MKPFDRPAGRHLTRSGQPPRFVAPGLFGLLVLAMMLPAAMADWRDEVSLAPAGSFPRLPDVRMHFSFGWSNVLEAAQADATIREQGGEYRIRVSGGTLGLARALWPLDAQHSATAAANGLRPQTVSQVEVYRRRTITTEVRYDAEGLERRRQTSDSDRQAKWKRINFQPIHDVITGVLYVRSQPLRDGDRVGVVAFPGDSPYLVVARVDRRETISVAGKSWPAIRLSLSIRKLEVRKKEPVEAVSYSKFRSGVIWVSDDALRLPLRAEVSVMVGFVYGELVRHELLN